MKIKLDFDSLGNTILLIQIIVCLLKISHVIKANWYICMIPLFIWAIVTLLGIGLAIYLTMRNKW